MGEKILVIKLSALGDFVIAFAAFARIRAAHPGAHITLLTTPPFEALGEASGFFDSVETNGRPKGLAAWLALIRRLRRARYTCVYDLQNNDRTNAYFQALRPFPPPWSGTAFGCALPHRNPARMRLHALERQAEQLRYAGVWPDAPVTPGSAPPPDISNLVARQKTGGTPALRKTALLVPGSSAHRPEKRWPAECYGVLARALQDEGFEIIIIGGAQERELARIIQSHAPGAIDRTGHTDFAEIAALGARAALAVGNDTGPMHLIAAAGAPCVLLFSRASDPALCAPRGKVTVLRANRLQDVTVETVLAAARQLSASAA